MSISILKLLFVLFLSKQLIDNTYKYKYYRIPFSIGAT